MNDPTGETPLGKLIEYLPIVTPTSRWTEDSPKLHFLDWSGDGKEPLLLLHGMAASAQWWAPAAQRLTSAFHCVALELRGHGDSDRSPDGLYDLPRYAQDVEAARRRLGWERMLLAGHSLGGRVALEYSVFHAERLRGVAAVDFLPEIRSDRASKFERIHKRPQPVYATRDEVLRRFRLEPSGSLVGPEAVRRLAETCVKETEGGYTWKFDWQALGLPYGSVWPTLPKVRVPVLLVRGQHSAVMPRPDFERMARELPNVQTVEIPRAHHHVPLDTPQELAGEILRFSGELKPTGFCRT
ncbi:MAG: alpha/beta hydrolase [Elusimicrobia bacterium]|nr:alpha/beta hydrolase [Elusimicrobiota bacterium]